MVCLDGVVIPPPEVGRVEGWIIGHTQEVGAQLWVKCYLRAVQDGFLKKIKEHKFSTTLPLILEKSLTSIYECGGACLVMFAPLRTTGMTL